MDNFKYCGRCKNFSVYFQDQKPINCSCKAKKFNRLDWEDYSKRLIKDCKDFKKV